MNNLLGSFVDMRRKGMRADSDSYCSIDKITDDSAKRQNLHQSQRFLLRKLQGKQGD